MVVDLIGIYGLKGPYCMLTTTVWFLQALSVIPRGSWGDVARRSYHDPMGKSGIVIPEPQCSGRPSPPLSSRRRRRPPCAAAATRLRRKFVSGQLKEENPFVLISSVLLVQADEGISFLVVDRIGDIYRNLPRRADVIVTTADEGISFLVVDRIGDIYRNLPRRADVIVTTFLVDWAVKMRIRPPELETSICDEVPCFIGLNHYTNYNLNLASNIEKPPPLLHQPHARSPPTAAPPPSDHRVIRLVLISATSEKFDLMVAISAGLKVNWAQVLFQILIAMVYSPSRQSQGFAVQLNVLLQRLVKADLRETVNLHPQKVLNNKPIHTYMKNNLGVGPVEPQCKLTVLPLNIRNHDLTLVDFQEVALPKSSSYAQHIELSIRAGISNPVLV
ncbi:hypothetical protein F511_37220 [Dorcoceras hygrometricum]|uniref:Uncharacterized protein n=1 Tax=Dorcoceras hygrometricum TaxID=472368 RepID=A0A2Z7B941_9LAMI|nr:hypothetical protein F511_37220 [Dorcoceras hygrometricum]